MTVAEWYADHDCRHAHCPNGCENPQPFMDGDKALCGRCANLDHQEVEMLPCTPDTCE